MEANSQAYPNERHKPVLLHEILGILNLKPGSVVVDANLGDGGHSEVIINTLKGGAVILGFDLDKDAIKRTQEYLKENEFVVLGKNLIPIQSNFSHMDTALEAKGFGPESVDAILFDLGLSTYDLIGSGKGFSFRFDEPLQMTFGTASEHAFTAYDIVNTWDEEDIANVIFAYGEERLARKIAKVIVEYRNTQPIASSKQLADLIEGRFGRKFGHFGKSKTHPATKTFQALRIAVNNELEHLRIALEKALTLLKSGGRMAVISYHSLEDRIVKQYVKEWAKEGKINELTKKPTMPTDEEIRSNPRSRSAKLRVIEKV